MTLDHVDRFIRYRLRRYDEKFRDRLFFHDPLIGYYAGHAESMGVVAGVQVEGPAV